MQACLRRFQADGEIVSDDDLRYLSPLMRRHLGLYGQYNFNQALIAQATASGLTVNDYLAQLLGLSSNGRQENGAHEPTPYELVEDILDSITFDSSVPDPDPSAQPRKTAFGQLVAEKLRKQGLNIP
jgi:hypothetical protein